MLSLYRQPLGLLTDFYELSMAYGYWKSQKLDNEAVFHLFFRRPPFQGGFAVAAGLESVIDYIQQWHFETSDLDYLSTLQAENGEPLFEEGFLTYLQSMKFSCSIDAVREGDIVFPYEPLLRIEGLLIQAQLLESALLTLINFATLIATKAARICLAAEGDPVLEFGVRRAQGIDGAMTASRSSFIGGCAATSNTLAGKLLKIPVRGTHAHSWVLAFDSEIQSFEAFAEAMPNHCVFLVDTFDTLQGVKNAIQVGQKLKEKGKKLLGIRLDSGDLNYLSVESRKLLDKAGFNDTQIYASNELNETLISDLKQQGAKIVVWGVGTHLVTGYGQPALDGVYKLSAFRNTKSEPWQYKLKLSERLSKISDPGLIQVRRFSNENQGYVADALFDLETGIHSNSRIIDPLDPTRSRKLASSLVSRDLLVPVFHEGRCVYQKPTLQEIQNFSKKELMLFDKSIKRFNNPHLYPVGMEERFYRLKMDLIDQVRGDRGR